MIARLIPKPLKSWLKAKIKSAAYDTSALRYIPYEYAAGWYLLPKHPPPPYATCDLGLAVPPKVLMAGLGGTKEDYLSGGYKDASKMLALAKASGFSFERGSRVLEFGCGAGRMIRYLKCFSDTCEIWGVDISAPHIFWAKQYLSPPFHFALTTTVPHLPFEDRFFDFIYCGSVFTHIDDLADPWLCELRRILSPAGRLYLTIHDGHTIELLCGPYRDDAALPPAMRAYDIYNASKSNLGMLVVGRGINSQVFYDAEYFCSRLSLLGFHILSVTQESYGYEGEDPARWPAIQTAVVVERR